MSSPTTKQGLAEVPEGDISTQPSLDNLAPTEKQSDLEKGKQDEQSNSTPPKEVVDLQQVVSTPGEPPNGGLKAWLQVLGGFMLFFNTWGLLNTFGVYQTYYESGDLFTASSSDISWIGSLQAFLVMVVGAFSGPIYDRGHLRILLLVGTFGIVFGHMMLSLCHEYWQALLAQGVVIGLGGGCLYIPAVAILPTYFNKRIGLAMGLTASGSSMGGVIYPIVFYRLLPRIGFGWAVRVLGFMTLGTLLIPLFVMQMRVKPAKARALLDLTAFKEAQFMIFVFGVIIGFIGLYVVLFYTSYFGAATGITDESLSFYLVPIFNAASVFGRTLPNILSDKVGPFNVIAPGAIIVSVLIFCLLAVTGVAGLVIEAIFLGFFSGIFIALPPVCFVHLTEDKSKIGTRMGMGFALFGIGVLCGGPGGGGILQRKGSQPNELDWTGTWCYAGATMMASACIFSFVRFMRAGFKPVKC